MKTRLCSVSEPTSPVASFLAEEEDTASCRAEVSWRWQRWCWWWWRRRRESRSSTAAASFCPMMVQVVAATMTAARDSSSFNVLRFLSVRAFMSRAAVAGVVAAVVAVVVVVVVVVVVLSLSATRNMMMATEEPRSMHACMRALLSHRHKRDTQFPPVLILRAPYTREYVNVYDTRCCIRTCSRQNLEYVQSPRGIWSIEHQYVQHQLPGTTWCPYDV